MILRDYQNDSIAALRQAIRAGHKRLLLQASTGAGKTIIASAMIESAVNRGNQVLFIAHRKEIIEQTSQKLDAFGIDHGVIMADHPRYKPRQPVQVASIQTISRRAKPQAQVVILDECHLSCSKSFTDLIAEYPDAIVIGLTATPTRLDGKGLGNIYTHMVQVVPMKRLISDGHLVKPRIFAPFTPDMSGVKRINGDVDANEAEAIMDKKSLIGDVVKTWLENSKGRKTIVFAQSIRTSEHIRDEFLANGIQARHLDAKTNKFQREKDLKDFENSVYPVLCNYGLFIEGLDIPSVSCVIMYRFSDSLTVFLQAVGRGMRPFPGKTDLIINDHAGMTMRHGMPDDDREWDLSGSKKTKKSKSEEKPISVTICQSCFAAFSRIENPEKCPVCKVALPAPKISKIKQGDGELVELTAEHIEAMKAKKKQELKQARTLEDLIALGHSRGYKNPAAWAGHIIEGRQAWRNKQAVAYG